MNACAPSRILHVVESFGSGVGEVSTTLAERQAKGGDTVAIAHGRCPETPADARSFVASTVALYEMPWEARSIREQLEVVRHLRQLVAAWQPDLVHLHSSFAGVVGAVALEGSIPSVYTPHGYSFMAPDRSAPLRVLYRAVERFTAARVDIVGAVSESEAQAARIVAPSRKVKVVRNGIPELDSAETDPPLARAPRAACVVTVGRIAHHHLPSESAKILAAVSDLAEVVWVGGAGRGGIPESTVTDWGVPVTGWIGRGEVLASLRSAVACLHWTACDAQPLTVLEAMASDAIVVARDIKATREILGPRQVCRTQEEAIDLLREIIEQPALRAELLQSQRLRRGAYGAQRMTEDWRRVYEQLLDRGRRQKFDARRNAAKLQRAG